VVSGPRTPSASASEEPVCALCGAKVTGVDSMPARQAFDHTGATVEVPAWCRLKPCGHTFTARLPLAS
jgi:hypothetical protein